MVAGVTVHEFEQEHVLGWPVFKGGSMQGATEPASRIQGECTTTSWGEHTITRSAVQPRISS
jgi:hypothetical protein